VTGDNPAMVVAIFARTATEQESGDPSLIVRMDEDGSTGEGRGGNCDVATIVGFIADDHREAIWS
jgi:hypothetical protein